MTKRKSNIQKGTAFERKMKEWFEEQGWVVDRKPRWAKEIKRKNKKTGLWEKIRISNSIDFFKSFDLIAKKGNLTLWIQTTTDSSSLNRKRKTIEENYIPINPKSERKMIIIKRKGGKIDIYIFKEPLETEIFQYGSIIRNNFYLIEKQDYLNITKE